MAWQFSGGECYSIEDTMLGADFFGARQLLVNKVFADLKTFSQKKILPKLAVRQIFYKVIVSLRLLIIDSSYVYLSAKDRQLLQQLVERA